MALIGTTDLSVKEMARELGFPHGSHFCRMCRRSLGMTPAEAIRRFRHI